MQCKHKIYCNKVPSSIIANELHGTPATSGRHRGVANYSYHEESQNEIVRNGCVSWSIESNSPKSERERRKGKDNSSKFNFLRIAAVNPNNTTTYLPASPQAFSLLKIDKIDYTRHAVVCCKRETLLQHNLVELVQIRENHSSAKTTACNSIRHDSTPPTRLLYNTSAIGNDAEE